MGNTVLKKEIVEKVIPIDNSEILENLGEKVQADAQWLKKYGLY